MRIGLSVLAIMVIAALCSCGAAGSVRRDGMSLASTATIGDMLNIIGDGPAPRPYSQYLFRVTDGDGREVATGPLSLAQSGGDSISLIIAGDKLKVVVADTFIEGQKLDLRGSDQVSFDGGYAAGGRIAIVPGVVTPVEIRPSWFPSMADVTTDRKGRFLVRINKTYENHDQKLVAFMDAWTVLEGMSCRILGTFDTVPQLKRLVTELRRQGKYDDESHYVLRTSSGAAFALVVISGERGRP